VCSARSVTAGEPKCFPRTAIMSTVKRARPSKQFLEHERHATYLPDQHPTICRVFQSSESEHHWLTALNCNELSLATELYAVELPGVLDSS